MRNILHIFLYFFLFLSCEDTTKSENHSVLRLLWSIPLNRQVGGTFELPLIEGNRVYFPNGKNIECRELETGKSIWTYKISDLLDYNGCNFTTNSTLLVINDAYKTVGVNKLTGEKLWVTPDVGEFRENGSTSYLTETCFFRGGFDTRGYIHEYDAGTGLLKQRFKFKFPESKVNCLSIKDGMLLCTTIRNVDDTLMPNGNRYDLSFGEIYGFELSTGLLKYQVPIQPRFIDSQYQFTQSSLFANILLVGEDAFTSFKDGTVVKFDIQTGKVQWMYRTPAEGILKRTELIRVHLNRAGTKLFATGSMDNWFCLNPENGELVYSKQKTTYNSVIDGSSYDGNRYVFKPSAQTTYEWYIIDIETGEIIEIFDQEGDSILTQDIANGFVAGWGINNFYVYKIVK